MSRDSLCIRDVLIVPGGVGAPLPYYGWVEVRDGKFADMGQGSPKREFSGEGIEGNGDVLLPGLMNLHAHSHSSLTRGSAEGASLEDWLTMVEREQQILTEEDAYTGALATYAEAVLSGTTTILDMCLKPRAAIAAARDIGIRAIIAPYAADTKPFSPPLELTEELLQATSNQTDPVQVWVGLHDLESCSDDQIQVAAALAKKYGTGLHMHCSESRFSVEATRGRTGRTPIQQLGELCALTDRTLLAHCVWADEADQRLLRENGTHVTHCPHANLKLGSGFAPVPAMLEQGINVCLGTDGAKANNRLDMFDVMKFASLLHKGIKQDPRVLPANVVLDMATHGAAKAIHNPFLGLIAPGMTADFITIRTDDYHLLPMVPDTVVTNLVHAVRGSDASLVFVNGRMIARDGELVSKQGGGLLGRYRQTGLDLLDRTA